MAAALIDLHVDQVPHVQGGARSAAARRTRMRWTSPCLRWRLTAVVRVARSSPSTSRSGHALCGCRLHAFHGFRGARLHNFC